MKLKNLGSNQTLISLLDGTEVLFSYDTPVAGFYPSVGYIRTSTNHSMTTSKHINSYLGDRKAKKVDQFILDNLLEKRTGELYDLEGNIFPYYLQE